MKLIVLFSMIFLHIMADFNLQGILGELKQKEWWKNNYPDKQYKYDYIICLILHSFSWSFMIMLPLVFYYKKFYVSLFIFNVITHCIIDHKKANKLDISLTNDQMSHLAQIIVTFLTYLIIKGAFL